MSDAHHSVADKGSRDKVDSYDILSLFCLLQKCLLITYLVVNFKVNLLVILFVSLFLGFHTHMNHPTPHKRICGIPRCHEPKG